MIPRIIHYCWFGGRELPERDKKNIEQWKRLCPEFEIKRWDESNYDIKKNKYMWQAYCNHKLGFVPDYARLDIIYDYGGFYFDTDVELIKNLECLIDEKCIMGFESVDRINHGHGFASEPKNEIIRELRDTYESISFVNDDGTLNLTASPAYISRFMEKKGVVLNNTEQIVDNIHVVPTDFFCPKNMFTGKINITKNTVSIHHFNMSWMDDQELKKMNAIKTMSKYLGKTVAYNVVEFYYNIKNKGLKEASVIICNKMTNRGTK